MEYAKKLKNDNQLTHKNYMRIEQENSYLNFRADNLDSRVKDHNYQYACLKYELEHINRQKCDLISKLNGIPGEQSKKQLQSNDSSKVTIVKKKKSPKDFAGHAGDMQKLPEKFCSCGVQLKSDQILKDHIRYHNSKGRFACKICGLKTSLLKHHMKRIHRVKEFTSSKGCRTCGKLLNTLNELHEHRRREHGRKRKGETWDQYN